jgi:hypothetical protein
MPSQLVSSTGCCQPCDTVPVVVNVPGPQGAAGTNGTNGANGENAFSYTTASFVVPTFGASVVVAVANTSFLPESVAGQFFVSVQGCGYLQVTSVDGLLVTLQNPLAGVLGISNAIPTTVIPIGSLITLSGAIGATGAAGAAGGASSAATYIVRTPDASIPSATALSSLSSGYLKTQGSSGFGAVSTVATVPVGDISGVLPVANGGTNVATVPTNGQLLIGNGSGYTVASLTAGSNITITPGAGTISIASTASGAAFSYVTFTRRLTGDNFVASGTTKNPFSLGDFPSGSWLTLDPASGFTAATGRFTVPYTGYYRIDALFNLFAPPAASIALIVYLRKNGSNVLQTLNFTVANTTPYSAPISINYIDQATAITDFYEVFIASTTVDGVTASLGSSFSIQRIQA